MIVTVLASKNLGKLQEVSETAAEQGSISEKPISMQQAQ